MLKDVSDAERINPEGDEEYHLVKDLYGDQALRYIFCFKNLIFGDSLR